MSVHKCVQFWCNFLMTFLGYTRRFSEGVFDVKMMSFCPKICVQMLYAFCTSLFWAFFGDGFRLKRAFDLMKIGVRFLTPEDDWLPLKCIKSVLGINKYRYRCLFDLSSYLLTLVACFLGTFDRPFWGKTLLLLGWKPVTKVPNLYTRYQNHVPGQSISG